MLQGSVAYFIGICNIYAMSKQIRREKFVDLAKGRVNGAIKELRLIGNLSNRGNYVYTIRALT